MKDYGRQRSTVEPLGVELTEAKVFVASNISPVAENEGAEQEFVGFEFDLTEYTKDEYIQLQAERNAVMENELTAAQLALCDVYEMIS
jgi:hypothetical protein